MPDPFSIKNNRRRFEDLLANPGRMTSADVAFFDQEVQRRQESAKARALYEQYRREMADRISAGRANTAEKAKSVQDLSSFDVAAGRKSLEDSKAQYTGQTQDLIAQINYYQARGDRQKADELSRQLADVTRQRNEQKQTVELANSFQYDEKGAVELDALPADVRKNIDLLASRQITEPQKSDYFNGTLNGSSGSGVFDIDPTPYGEDTESQQARIALRQAGYTDEQINQLTDYSRRQMNKKNYLDVMEQARNNAQKHAAAESIRSVGTNLGAGMGIINAAWEKKVHPDRAIDFYDPSMLASGITTTIRDQVSKDLAIKHPAEIGGTNIASFLYQTGMSIADSSVNGGLALIGAGAAGAAGQTLMGGFGLTILGGSAGTAAMQNAHDRGLSDEQALGLGLVAGAAEIVTEKIGLDTFLDTALGKGGKKWIAEIGKNMLAEGGEEVGSDVINLIADIMISKDKSEWQETINRYMAEGMSESEAFGRAVSDQLAGMAQSFAGGALSGGVMGAGGMAYRNADIRFREGGNSADIVGKALELDGNNELAKAAQARLDAGKKLSGDTLRRLIETNEQGVVRGDVATVRDSVQQRLMELGETADKAEELAPIIAKQFASGQIAEGSIASGEVDVTRAERKAIRESDAAEQVMDELYQLRQAPEWVGDIGTERVKTGTQIGREMVKQYLEEIDKKDKAALTVNDTARLEKEFGKAGAETFAKMVPAGVDERVYYHAFNTAFLYGEASATLEQAKEAVAGRVSDYIVEAAYAAGKGQADFLSQQAAENLAKRITSDRTRGAGKVDLSAIDQSKLTVTQKASIGAIMKIAAVTGINIKMFQSGTDSKDNFVGKNGSFNADTNTIEIDINAGRTNINDALAPVMLKTMGHELTHFIQENNRDGYDQLKEIVARRLLEKGHNLEDLAKEKVRRGKASGNDLTYEEAVDEVVADACENMLQDTNAIDRLAQENWNLFKQIRNWIRSFHAAIRRAFSAGGASSDEADWLLEDIAEIQEIWDDAFVRAVQNYQRTVDGREGVELKNSRGETVGIQDENGHVQESMRTYREGGRDELKKYLDQRVKEDNLTADEAKEMLEQMDFMYDVCKKFAEEYSLFGQWSEAEVKVDPKTGNPVFSVVKANGDYAMNLDFSLVCKKRRTLDAVFEQMINDGIMENYDMTEASIAAINDIIRDNDFETACALCFVDAKRYRQGIVADSFVSMYNELVRSMIREGQHADAFNFGGNSLIKNDGAGIDTLLDGELDFTKIDEVLKTAGKKTVLYKIADDLKHHPEDRKLLLRGDFMSAKAFDTIKQTNGRIMKLYNAKKGAGGPKAASLDVQYLSEILTQKKFEKEKAYSVGGVRIQSFSDYIPRLVFDYMQMLTDMQAKDLPAHAYTKEPLFVLQFGQSGVKINMSLVPEVIEGGVAPGLDKDGNYAWRDGQSFGSTVYGGSEAFIKKCFEIIGKKYTGQTRLTAAEGFELAKAIQSADGYHMNCGTIAVGISDEHIRKMLRDPNIRMVIPYHKSSLNHIVAVMTNIDQYEDYTDVQNTKRRDKKTGNWVNLAKNQKDFNFNEALRNLGDAKAAADAYLAWCDKKGYLPKFSQFRNEENYYKLLEDFTCYDRDGMAAPQTGVKLVLPTESSAFGSMTDLMRMGLDEDALLQGKQDAKVPEMVEQIKKALPGFEAEQRVRNNPKDSRSPVFVERAFTGERNYVGFRDYAAIKAAVDKTVGEIISSGGTVAIDERFLGREERRLDWKDVKSARERIKEILEDALGVDVTLGEGSQAITARLTREGLNHAASSGSTLKKAAILGKFLDIAVNSVYSYSTPHENAHSKGSARITQDVLWDSYVAVATLNGENIPVVIEVRSTDTELRGQIREAWIKKEAEAANRAVGQDEPAGRHLNYDDQSTSNNNIPQTGTRVNEQNSDRGEPTQRKKRRSAQEKRDAGEKLTESEFYSLYFAHKLDMRGRGDVDAQIENIKKEGFKGDGGFGFNVMPALQIVRYPTIDKYNWFLEKEKQGMFPEGYADQYRRELGEEYGTPVPDSLPVVKYGPRKGNYIMLVPESGVEINKDVGRVKAGYKPQFPYEFVQAEYDFQPYYEMYEKAYEKYSNAAQAASRVQNSDRDTSRTEALQAENDSLREVIKEFEKALKAKERELLAAKADISMWRDKATFHPERVAKALIKAYGSAITESEIHDGVKALVDLAARKDGFTYAQLREVAMPVARDVIKNARELINSDAVQTRKDILDHLRKGKILVSQAVINDIKAVESWGDFWRRNGRRFNLSTSKGGTPIDVAYAELGEMFGYGYFPTEITHPADQLRRIEEVYDALAPAYENPHSLNMAEAIDRATNDLIDAVMADVANGYGATYSGQLEEKLYQSRKRTEDLLQQERQRSDARVKALVNHWREQNVRALEKREDSELRDRLLKVARRLKNKKLPSVSRALLNQYIQQDLSEAAQQIFAQIDTESKGMRKTTRLDLEYMRDLYENLKENDPNFIPDPKTEERIKRLSKVQIESLTHDQVVELTYVLLHIENQIRYEKSLIDSAERREIFQAGQQIIEDIENAPGSKASGMRSLLDKLIITETLSPERQVRRMTGYVEDDPLTVATQELSKGQRKAFDYKMRAMRRFQEFVDNKALMKRIAGKNAETTTIRGIGKNGPVEVQITPAMKIALYLHAKNNQNLTHIAGGGIRVPDIDLYRKGKLTDAYDKGTTIRLEPAQVRAIQLTAEEKRLADAVSAYFNGMSRNEVNAVAEKLLGYPVAEVENYFPINTDDAFARKEFDNIKFDGTIEGMGWLKERIKSSAPIYLRDVTDVLLRAIDQHSKYVGLAIPVRNFNKLWGVTAKNYTEGGEAGVSSSVQSAVRQQWGDTGRKYIAKFMKDLQSGSNERDVWDRVFAKVRSQYAGAVLTLNASVAMKQAASYPTAAAVVGWNPLIKAFGNVGKVDLDLISKYTPLQWYRSQGYSTQELGDMAKRGMQLPPVLNWVQGADVLTTRKLWKAAEIYVRENMPNVRMGSAEDIQAGRSPFYRAVADVYNRIIEETQPNYTTMQRPQLLRSDSTLLQNLAMFKTQPFQNFNILYDAIGNLAAKERAAKVSDTAQAQEDLKKAKVNAVRALTSQAVSLAVFAGMTLVWNAFRGKMDKYKDDDEDTTLWSILSGVAKDMLGGLFGEIPFGGDIWELGSSVVTGGKYYGIDDVTASALSDAFTAIKNASGVLSGIMTGDITDINTARLKLDNVADAVSKVAGIPYENVVNLGKAMFLKGAKAIEGNYMGTYDYLKLTTDTSTSAGKGKYYDLLYAAYKNDKQAHADLYRQMVDDGWDPDAIKSAMENRMKKSEGVSSVKDLSSRYVAP